MATLLAHDAVKIVDSFCFLIARLGQFVSPFGLNVGMLGQQHHDIGESKCCCDLISAITNAMMLPNVSM
jgi:hypothetical protein